MFKKISDLLDLKVNEKSYGKSSDTGFNFLSLIHKWPVIVGDKLSKVTIPVKMQYGALTIMTNHSAYSQSLSFLEEELKKKIFNHFPELASNLKSFQFRVNTSFFEEERNKLIQRSHNHQPVKTKVASQEVKRELHPHNPEYKRLKAEAIAYFSGVNSDKEIEQELISIYIQQKISLNKK